jgi:hypothetical protein
MQRIESPASMRRANSGSVSSNSNTGPLPMCSNRLSTNAFGKHGQGRSRNITASPKLWRGPTICTTFSLPCAEGKASLIWPNTTT